MLNWNFLGNWFLRNGKRPFFRLFQNTWWNSSQIYRIYLSKSHILKKKIILFWLKNQLVIHVYTWQKLRPFKTSCEFYISYPSKHFKNALYSQISKILKKKHLIGFCKLCTFFQINISMPKLSLKHLPLKYDFITINIFIWVANKTLIQKK